MYTGLRAQLKYSVIIPSLITRKYHGHNSPFGTLRSHWAYTAPESWCPQWQTDAFYLQPDHHWSAFSAGLSFSSSPPLCGRHEQLQTQSQSLLSCCLTSLRVQKLSTHTASLSCSYRWSCKPSSNPWEVCGEILDKNFTFPIRGADYSRQSHPTPSSLEADEQRCLYWDGSIKMHIYTPS